MTGPQRKPQTIIGAIADHRSAWEAFQTAPDGPEGTDAYQAARMAEADLAIAEEALLATPPNDEHDIVNLAAHLDWLVVEEAEQPDAYDRLFNLHRVINLAMAAGRQDCFVNSVTKADVFDGDDGLRRAYAIANMLFGP